MGSISALPEDVLRCIFARCSAKTVAVLECTCRVFRSVGKQTPVQLHVTQANEDRIFTWATGRTVTKMTTRRVGRLLRLPETLLVLDSMYAKVSMPHLGGMRYLQRLRLHHVRMPEVSGTPRYPVFKMSSLPDSLVDVDIVFDATCRRVDVDGTKKIRVLSLATYPPKPGFPRQPDILVTRVDNDVVKLSLSTRGGITVACQMHTDVECAKIECEDNRDPRSVMKLFGPALDTLVLVMPRASVVWSEDFAGVNPRVLAVDVDFAAIDVVGPNLRTLEVRVDRLAYVHIPKRVELWACIRNTVIDPSFFRV